ncbi:hypothetical protein F6Q07_04105 [Pectobacterium parmentieri]|uniref:Uncharacterized protein n=1 Tax=Pectobacterium parmentieri TaxID=1905730 RepID=A0A0H3I4U2_PECPM|nr:hypothetical protein [Pectobacterium parmentieri]ACX88738.1 hypothetical protein Pecwa_2992 [Pectobacterium parmentieri WPP163]AFI91059.1 Hypothetical protein W5S_2976 [Pectobacterium parmentieri]AYH02151.1 hypothetical protein C5E26_15040 [Pectobacterium parmentieri]AYH06414.1 hypothetical protein C5E25_14180 [Pectobacterium parmentieri]AYH15232.1 hypothetical protein C5E23_14150 [Pectobacterium parmentieri]
MPSKFETLQEETTFSLADLYGDDISPDAAKADMLAFERSMDDMLPALLSSATEKTASTVDTLRKKFAVVAKDSANADEIVFQIQK